MFCNQQQLNPILFLIAQLCSTVSTAYVHGGRTGVLPEVLVEPSNPPSRWHPLEPAAREDGTPAGRRAYGSAVRGSLISGHADAATNSTADGDAHSDGHAATSGSSNTPSILGGYLDLDTELAYAEVRSLTSTQIVILLDRGLHCAEKSIDGAQHSKVSCCAELSTLVCVPQIRSMFMTESSCLWLGVCTGGSDALQAASSG